MKQVKMRALSALVSAVCATGASAGGFQLMEQNASGLGNAYAGSAAVAENASTIYHNPAGMAYLPGINISVGAASINTHATYHANGASSGGDAGVSAIVPNAYVSWGVNSKVTLGLGISSPFGLSTEYQPGWAGQDHGLKTSIRTMNINPSLAYKVSDDFSLGGGLNYQTVDAEMNNTAAGGLASSKLKGSDASWGWNIGAMYKVSPSMRLGVSYRSAIRHTLEGDSTGIVNAPVKAEMKLPGTFILSVYQQLSDRWESMGDLTHTQWNTISTFDVYRRDTGAQIMSDPYGYKNSWRASWGMNYKYDESTKFKFGLAYDTTPTNGIDRSPRLPDANRVWLSTGVQYRPTKGSVLDVGYTYVYMNHPSINHYNANGVPKYLNGSYNSSAHILGAQYSYGF